MKEEQEFDEIFAQEEKKTHGLRNIIVGIIIIIIAVVVAIAVWPVSEEPAVAKHEVIKDDVISAEKDLSKSSKDAPEANQDPNAELDKIIADIKNSHENSMKHAQDPENVEKVVDKMADTEKMSDKSPEKADAPKTVAQNTVPAQKIIPIKPVNPKISAKNSFNEVKNGGAAQKGVYLQMGVFAKTPSRDFIARIKRHSYRTHEIEINGEKLKKYLVGPFKTRKDAAAYKNSHGLNNTVIFVVK